MAGAADQLLVWEAEGDGCFWWWFCSFCKCLYVMMMMMGMMVKADVIWGAINKVMRICDQHGFKTYIQMGHSAWQ